MGYRESAPATHLRDLVETAWVVDGSGEPVHVLPDGCMDVIRMHGRIVVAGPDTASSVSTRGPEPFVGLRFRPGALPRLLGVPASELRNARVPLAELVSFPSGLGLDDVVRRLMLAPARRETTPWPLATTHHVTASLARGATVAAVARELGWSTRTLQRQCRAVYGYGPATLRRILRFRGAASMLGNGWTLADVAALTGYADQPHLHREIREFAGMPAGALADRYVSGANKSTDVPSGSVTVA